MKNNKWVSVFGIALLVLGSIIGIYIYATENKSSDTVPTKATSPIIDDQGGIQVVAIWEKSDSLQQKFQLQLNNHSWDLNDYEFKNNILLKKNGTEISFSVISEKRNPEGHHVASEIVVESPEFVGLQDGDELTMIVKNIFDTPERTFTWSY
ncbi:MAG: hypothetical protein APF84_01105 [Gracilibacter sp. BRH_c7a]|nr:MAG: hypothetical protein APF84_01105 [Gracilibacter sp. BRH_c7a]